MTVQLLRRFSLLFESQTRINLKFFHFPGQVLESTSTSSTDPNVLPVGTLEAQLPVYLNPTDRPHTFEPAHHLSVGRVSVVVSV
jgi:hypothetical protein